MSKPTYTSTTWVDNTTPAINAANLNHLEQGVSAVTVYAGTSVQSVVAGTGVTVNNTDPANPVITATGGGGGSGTVDSVVAADSTITVNDADPANPTIKVTGGTFAPATSGTSLLKGNGSGGFSNAAAGTDYAPATSGTSILKGNGTGGTAAATAGTDYVAPSGSITGNAATATKLATARTINGVAFDGTANVTVADSTKVPTTEVGAANGVASLDASALLLTAELPPGSTLTQASTTSWPARLTSRTDVYVRWVDVGGLGTTPSGALDGDSLVAA